MVDSVTAVQRVVPRCPSASDDLGGDGASPSTVDVSIGGGPRLASGSHVCARYSGEIERGEMLTPYLRPAVRAADMSGSLNVVQPAQPSSPAVR